MQYSSGHRELVAVLAALKQGAKDLSLDLGVRSVFWLTDSANLVVFLTKGSTKKPIQKDILEVFKLAREARLDIISVHLHREDFRIQVADYGSNTTTQMTGRLIGSPFWILPVYANPK